MICIIKIIMYEFHCSNIIMEYIFFAHCSVNSKMYLYTIGSQCWFFVKSAHAGDRSRVQHQGIRSSKILGVTLAASLTFKAILMELWNCKTSTSEPCDNRRATHRHAMLRTLACSIIGPWLYYCYALLFGTMTKSIDQLQRSCAEQPSTSC